MEQLFNNHQRLIKKSNGDRIPELPKLLREEKAFLLEYLRVMKPLQTTCVWFQSEKAMFWGSYAPFLQKMEEEVKSFTDLVFCEPLKLSILTCKFIFFIKNKDNKCINYNYFLAISRRFHGYGSNHNLMATMLHPTFKRKYVEKKFPHANVAMIEKRILDELNVQKDEETNTQKSKKTPIDDNFIKFFADENENIQSDDDTNKVLVEEFFAESEKSVSILLNGKYAKIKHIFIKYNSNIVSSAACERLFSLSKHILTAPRTLLSDKTFEKLVILNNPLKMKSR